MGKNGIQCKYNCSWPAKWAIQVINGVVTVYAIESREMGIPYTPACEQHKQTAEVDAAFHAHQPDNVWG